MNSTYALILLSLESSSDTSTCHHLHENGTRLVIVVINRRFYSRIAGAPRCGVVLQLLRFPPVFPGRFFGSKVVSAPPISAHAVQSLWFVLVESPATVLAYLVRINLYLYVAQLLHMKRVDQGSF